MYNPKNKKPRFNPNPQKQPRGEQPQPLFGPRPKPLSFQNPFQGRQPPQEQPKQPRKQQTPFQGRQPQQPQPIQPIPAQPTNDLQNEVFALQQEIESLKQISVASDKQITELRKQVVEIIEHLNQSE